MNRIRVVLHRSIYPRNIGMCARSMANMGVEQLILVAPQTELTEEAKQGAVHAQEVLRTSKIYKSLDEFYKNEGEGLRIALSGRDGKDKVPERLDEVFTTIKNEADHLFHDSGTPIYLFFGPEDDGLSDYEMELCHYVCRLPTYGEITSLNLSHAVLLTLYIVRTALGDEPTIKGSKAPEAIFYPSGMIKTWLEVLGFDLSHPKVNIEKTLNRILLSRAPKQEELRILNTVIQQTIRKLQNNLKTAEKE